MGRKQAEPRVRGTKNGAERPRLTRERIVETAIRIVDRDGLDALSMRRLGSELGVDPMAVYYYLPNKSALLDALVEAVMAEIDLGLDDPSRSPEDRLVVAASEYRDALLAHAKALPVVLVRGPRTPASLEPVDVLLGILLAGGLSGEEAVAAMDVVVAFVRGAVATQADHEIGSEHQEDVDPKEFASLLASGDYPNLIMLGEGFHYPGFDAEFEMGIRALATGLFGARG